MAESARTAAQYYRLRQVQTAPASRRICMLHERCFELIRHGRLQSGPERDEVIVKAQNIIAQLQAVLRLGDAVSQSLFYLYDYAYVMLERGEWQDLSNALAIIKTLRDTFRKLSRR